GIRVRESMGLSKDKRHVYVKTMDGNVLGISTRGAHMDITWRSDLQLPYELSPSAIETNRHQVFVASHAGLGSGVRAADGRLLWQYKLSNSMINPILVSGHKDIFVSTMDGVIGNFKLLKDEQVRKYSTLLIYVGVYGDMCPAYVDTCQPDWLQADVQKSSGLR